MKKQVLIVDGYNMIGAWPNLAQLKKHEALEEAREELLRELSNYATFKKLEVIVVFDAQFVPGISQTYEQYQLQVVFTASDETADSYIEALAYERMNVLTQVTVATSDLAEQWQIFSAGALRKSARELYQDVHKEKKQVAKDAARFQYENYQRNVPWNDKQLSQLEEMLNELQK